jgi:hypothetical protein
MDTNTPLANQEENQASSPQGEVLPATHPIKNIYPVTRHFMLIVLTLLAFTIIIFLIYQNGRSIYENGI